MVFCDQSFFLVVFRGVLVFVLVLLSIKTFNGVGITGGNDVSCGIRRLGVSSNGKGEGLGDALGVPRNKCIGNISIIFIVLMFLVLSDDFLFFLVVAAVSSIFFFGAVIFILFKNIFLKYFFKPISMVE